MRPVLFALLALTAPPLPALAQEGEPLPPGYPPKLGEVQLVEAGKSTRLTTYDFSIGAFDASAWFGEGLRGRGFQLMAYPDENPDATKGRLFLWGGLDAWAPGKTRAALVEILMGTDIDGRRWTSAGKPAELVIDSFTPQEKGHSSGYGHVTGHFSATVCSGDKDPVVVAPNARCREVSGRFATDAQYSP